VAKTILVIGDVFLQENALVQEGANLDGNGTYDPLFVKPMAGGACRLAELARAAIGNGGENGFEVVGPMLPQHARRAFAVWNLFPPVEGKAVPVESRVWRVERHLGAERFQPVAPFSYDAGIVDQPDVLLIEDLNLGFRHDKGVWPKALLELGDGVRIVLRTSAPLGKGLLWEHLLPHADRLTVVVSADALRAQSAGLTAPLSWDQTIEEVAAEFEGARFANDLALVRRVVVQFGTDGAASFTRLPLFGEEGSLSAEPVRFERCLYDPQSLEGAWTAKRPGIGIDETSMLAAAMARHELDPLSSPLFIALGRGLAAARRSHEVGGGLGRNPFSLSVDHIEEVFHPEKGEPAAAFYTAFPHSLLDDEKLRDRPASKSDLLRDFTGSGFESVVSTGMDVVFRGIDVALKPVPKSNYGKYTTADRDEIERLNSIRNLIAGYLKNEKDTRPLSFAVFGPPGSGKSFAVKQLMRDVAGDVATSLEFNLSQMSGLAELHQAFHRVRDASIQNRIPFVFWDEFDTGDLQWLKDFLAPMQDSVFHAGGLQHAFGKAIFIFAGGTAASLAEFNVPKNDSGYEAFKKVKGPDFVSRLRGHIDVKGPNRENGATGYSHVIRRAILVRKLLEGNAPRLIDRETQTLAIDAGVVRAFLTATEYIHGARSVEAVVTMSNLVRAAFFGLAELPGRDLLESHVSGDFEEQARAAALDARAIDALARANHRAYSACVQPVVPFDKLPLGKQESNRASVRATLVTLGTLGYRLVQRTPGASCGELQESEGARLKRLEHDRWLREVLLGGWAWAEKTNREIQLNENIVPASRLSKNVEPLDLLAAQTVLAELPRLGFVLVKKAVSVAAAGGGQNQGLSVE
jgi:hypothetical protein